MGWGGHGGWLVGWLAGGLDHKDVRAADVLVDLDEGLPVGKRLHRGATQGDSDGIADRLG